MSGESPKDKTLTIPHVPIERHHEFTRAFKDSGLDRAQLLEVKFNKADLYDKDIAAKNNLITRITKANEALIRTIKKMNQVTHKLFGVEVSDNEDVLDSILNKKMPENGR